MSKLANFAVKFLAVTAALGVTAAADAAFYTFPGNRCVPQQQGSASYVDNTLVANAGTAVSCPLMRRAPDAQPITGIGVGVRDGTSQQGIECMARSCNPNGLGCSNSSVASTTAQFTGFSILSLGSVAGFTNGTASMSCTLPSPGTGSGQGVSYVAGFKWND